MNGRQLLPFQGWRLVMFRAVVVFSLIVLVLRMGDLQFTRGHQFVQDAEENRLQLELIAAPRGAIYDRNRVPLAKNDPAYNVSIVPADLPDDPNDVLIVYNRLSALIDVPATRAVADAAGRTNERSLDEMVKEGAGIAPYRAVLVAKDIPRLTAFRIWDESELLPGVSVQVASVREYPSGSTTAHVVGYLGPIGPEEETRLRELGYDPAFDRIGYAGIEAFLEDELSGERGTQTWVVDVAGRPLRLVEEQKFQAGKSVQLTLDLDLQKAAQAALVNQLFRLKADQEAEGIPANRIPQQGVVIAMDPLNGDVLAMVSYPSYDNTRFARSIDGDYYFKIFDDPLRPLVNHAISALYPPGSVWKLITSFGIVEEHVIDPYDSLYCPGKLVLPNAYAPRDISQGQTFVCWLKAGHQEVNLLKAIAQSCDVYYYQAGGGNPEVSTATLREGGLGILDLYRWATAFGVGSELGVELPGELSGRMPDAQWKRRNYGESWSTGDTYNAAFGQGYVTITPLQLVNAAAAIANGGTLYQPSIVKNLQDANGTILEEFQPRIARTIVLKPGEDVVLLLQEDMLLQGANSLACRCETDSDFYDEASCDPANYTAQFDRDTDPDDEVHDWVQYRVNVPYNYTFNGGVCDQLEYESLGRESLVEAKHQYIPPFAQSSTASLIEQGMRLVVLEGTSSAAYVPTYPPLPYVNEAGKTGTAEYCDDIAFANDLCKQGQWPSHAWYVEYAPYEAPEIIVIAFVYNGGEGSAVAAPVARAVVDAYFDLKRTRGQQ